MNESKKAKSYTAEFKESAVKLALESKRPLAQTARELRVSKNTLYGWVREYHGKPQPVPEVLNSEPLYEELKRLRREVSILKEERDILKKRWRTLRSMPREVCLYASPSGGLFDKPDVSGFRGFAERVLRVAESA